MQASSIIGERRFPATLDWLIDPLVPAATGNQRVGGLCAACNRWRAPRTSKQELNGERRVYLCRPCRDLFMGERQARKRAQGITQVRGFSANALRRDRGPRIAFSSGGHDLYSGAEVSRYRRRHQ